MPPRTRPTENVWKYPRPPALQQTNAHLRVIWKYAKSGEEVVIADTKKGYRVLETSHPPTYYFPPEDVKMSLMKTSSARRTMCEWKGMALYHDFAPQQEPLAKARAWSYPSPTPSFTQIKDYLCFYASSSTNPNTVGGWTCVRVEENRAKRKAMYVDDDAVQAQEGDFYGSWITPEITGGDRGFKGGAETWGW